MGLGVILELETQQLKSPGREREPAKKAGASERNVTQMCSLKESFHASRATALTVHQHGQTLVYTYLFSVRS